MCDPWKEGLMSKKERMSGPHESLKLSVLWKLASRDWEDRLKTPRKYLSKASVRKNDDPKYTRNTLAHVCACRLAPARGPRGPPWDNSKAIRLVNRQGFSLELKAPQLAWAHKVHSIGCPDPSDLPISVSPVSWLQEPTTTTGLWHGCWRPNSGPHCNSFSQQDMQVINRHIKG